VNLDAIAKRVAHKETLPRCGSAIVNLYACGLQFGPQPIYVCTLNAEVPLDIRSQTLLLYREVNVKPTRIKPDAASNSKRLRLGNLSKAKLFAVERTGNFLAALRQCHIDV
jgi:hypothetical protein